MKGMRSTRGGRVMKPSAPTARGRPGRHQAGGQLAVQDSISDQVKSGQESDDGVGTVFEDAVSRMPEQFATAAAVMEADMTHGDAEADADMEDDDDPTSTAAAASSVSHLALAATASLLANSEHQPVDGPHRALQQSLPQLLPQGMAPILPQALAGSDPGPQPLTAQLNLAAISASSQSAMDPNVVKTTEQLAAESGYHDLLVESALAKRLAREPGLRHAQQRRPDQNLNLSRRSNVEALFAHIAGSASRVNCKNCHKGHGPWTSCVVIDGQMCGSCANCWFNASGARCSFHEARQPQSQHQPQAQAQTQVQHQHQPQPQHQPQHQPPHQPAMPGPSGLPGDNSYHAFGAPHLLPPAPAPTLPAAFGLPMASPAIQQMFVRIFDEVRNADLITRKLMQIEITTKQLAIFTAEYEELVAAQEQAQAAQAAQGHGHGQAQGQGHQGMGDESGA